MMSLFDYTGSYQNPELSTSSHFDISLSKE